MSTGVKENVYYKYVEASFLGASRGLLGFPLEHPFDAVKTRMQANPGALGPVGMAQKIYAQEGVRGFYTGGVPNAVRLAIKQMYRFPMMLALPKTFREILPDAQSSSVEVATGLTIAGFETYVICPLERLKIELMTRKRTIDPVTHQLQRPQLQEFFKQYKGRIFPELTRGLNASFARQISTWVSFLVANKEFKNWEKKRTGQEQLSFASLLRVSFLVGSVNTAANMPFDVVKTNLQKEQHFANEGLFRVMKKVYQTHGMRGLYTGWQVRMVHYMLHSLFSVTLLDRLESSWRKK